MIPERGHARPPPRRAVVKEAEKGKSRSPSKKLIPFHCNKFLRDGVCPLEKEGKTCKYPHLNQEQYDAEVARLKAEAAKAKK